MTGGIVRKLHSKKRPADLASLSSIDASWISKESSSSGTGDNCAISSVFNVQLRKTGRIAPVPSRKSLLSSVQPDLEGRGLTDSKSKHDRTISASLLDSEVRVEGTKCKLRLSLPSENTKEDKEEETSELSNDGSLALHYSTHSLRKVGPPKEDTWKEKESSVDTAIPPFPSLSLRSVNSTDETSFKKVRSPTHCIKPSEVVEEAKKFGQDSVPKNELAGNVKALATLFVDSGGNGIVASEDMSESESKPVYDLTSLKKVDAPNEARWKHMKDDPSGERLEPSFAAVELKAASDLLQKKHSFKLMTGKSKMPTSSDSTSDSTLSRGKKWNVESKDDDHSLHGSQNSLPTFCKNTKARTPKDVSDHLSPQRGSRRRTFSFEESMKNGTSLETPKNLRPSFDCKSPRMSWNSNTEDAENVDNSMATCSKKSSTSHELEALRAMALTKNWSTVSFSTATNESSSKERDTEKNKVRKREVAASSGFLPKTSIAGRGSSSKRRPSLTSRSKDLSKKDASLASPIANSKTAISKESLSQELEGVRSSLRKVSISSEPRKVVQRWNPTRVDSANTTSAAMKELEAIRAMGLAKAVSLYHVDTAVTRHKAGHSKPSFDVLLDSESERFISGYALTFGGKNDQMKDRTRRGYPRASRSTKAFFIPAGHSSAHRHGSSNANVSSDNRSSSTAPADLDCARSVGSSVSIRARAYQPRRSPSNDTTRSADAVDELPPTLSMNSEYTTSIDDGLYSYGGEDDEANRYIQISLSSGGIATKYEPNVAMSRSEDSDDPRNSLEESSPSMTSVSPTYSSPEKYNLQTKGDRRKSRELLKGAAKRFFFGKKKKRSI